MNKLNQGPASFHILFKWTVAHMEIYVRFRVAINCAQMEAFSVYLVKKILNPAKAAFTNMSLLPGKFYLRNESTVIAIFWG